MAPVIVYSNNTCPNCVNLKRALKLKGVEFTEINLHETPEAAADIHAQGLRQLPVMNDNGNWMMGFTPSNFNKILQARVAVPA